LLQLGVAVPLYFCGLSLIFLLFATNGKDTVFIERKVEPAIHAVVWLFALSSSIVSLALGLFNSQGQFCYIEPSPYDCDQERFGECTRGELANTFIWIFSVAPVLLSLLVTAALMAALYYSVWKQEQSFKARYGDAWNGNPKRLREVRTQAFRFMFGFFMTWMWTAFLIFLEPFPIFGGVHGSSFWLDVPSTFTIGLQGFFNFAVYIRSPLKNTRSKNPDKDWISCLWETIVNEPDTTPMARRRSSVRRSYMLGSRDNSGSSGRLSISSSLDCISGSFRNALKSYVGTPSRNSNSSSSTSPGEEAATPIPASTMSSNVAECLPDSMGGENNIDSFDSAANSAASNSHHDPEDLTNEVDEEENR
jgi:hypothetical protein